jgi:ribosomal protein S18 acetylase RimI-like enzyme
MYGWVMQQLRPYQTADFTSIVGLFHLNTPSFFHPQEQADLEAFLADELENYYVIENEGEVVACGGSNAEEGTGWLSWYIVHPDYQGKGLGRQLVDKNLEILKRDTRVTEIEVRTSQLTHIFYEKAGFVLIETADDYWGPGLHLYRMKLRP